jgi:hypothetical protein
MQGYTFTVTLGSENDVMDADELEGFIGDALVEWADGLAEDTGQDDSVPFKRVDVMAIVSHGAVA